MNYCKQIAYTYYTSPKADFDVMLDDVLKQISTDGIILRLVCWCSPSDNQEYEQWLLAYRHRIYQTFIERVPGSALVAQTPLGCGMVLEVQTYYPTNDDVVSYKKYDKLPYVLVENSLGRFLFASGFHGSGLLSTATLQADAAFEHLVSLLQVEGFSLSSITRQWNYIERITELDGEDQRYQSFNNVRADYYATDNWINGYPAATGIGASFGGVCIDVDAVLPVTKLCVITPIDNRLQVAAHAYSSGVILCSGHKKYSPKFERAKMVSLDDGSKLIYVSGTAAIRGEESLEGVGLSKQLEVTLENIAQLTEDVPLRHVRVYLKASSDYEETARLLDEKLPNVTKAYLEANVCRDALLIEIEGIAQNNN